MYVVYLQVHLLGLFFIFTCNEVMFCLLSTYIMGVHESWDDLSYNKK